MTTRRFLRSATVCCFALFLVGCQHDIADYTPGNPSPFANHYRGHLAGFTLPSTSELASTGTAWLVPQSSDQVWSACLEILSQCQGVLGTSMEGSSRVVCVIKGREANIAPENAIREATFGAFYDQWIAVSVAPGKNIGSSVVHVAAIDPMTGKLRGTTPAAQALFAQLQIQLFSVPQWREKFASPNWNMRPPRKSFTPPMPKMPTARQQELEQTLGDWVAKRMRIELGLVHCPEVTRTLDEVARRLLLARGATNVSVTVRILASPQVNAFALPSGNVFVTSGVLDAMETPDEVAAILAHELDHVVEHDVLNRIKKKAAGEASSAALRTAWTFANFAASVFVPTPGLAEGLARSVGEGMAGHAVHAGANHLQFGLVGNFSADVELRADENGLATLYAAGFDPGSNLAMLKVLQEHEADVLKKNETVMSNLINMQPGLESRIQKLSNVVKELQIEPAQTSSAAQDMSDN